MSTPPASTPLPSQEPIPYDPELEIRYAVVMYGGVSLAIYINGVAQELLDLVAATAPAQSDAGNVVTLSLLPAKGRPLRGAQRVYRKISQHLWDYRRGITPVGGEKDDGPIRVRFVVDVISGTSAGGINGLFLAKALANDESMQGLKQLWLNEGDFSRLLNDEESVRDIDGLDVATPQSSLLNSQRMYHILLKALDSMERKDRPDTRTATPADFTKSPFVHELDLFITTTDIRGLVAPIKLADKPVWEPRYKNVFHFRYEVAPATGTNWNDFVKKNDPFLAFAARCTSSFPFAFEPMRLETVPDIAQHFSVEDHPYKHVNIANPDWEHFYSEYFGTTPGQDDLSRGDLKKLFAERSFGDGGYLNNKPFSHATSMLLRRYADVPVERKLVYVEPSPEHPENRPEAHTEINFFDNAMAALGDLPRAQTIREDLDRITDRNRAIRRVRNYLADVERNLAAVLEGRSLDRLEFEKRFPSNLIAEWGPAYAAYHRIKVDSITVLLADRIARAADIDPASDLCLAVQALIIAWRRQRYAERPGNSQLPSENLFLRRFDLPYALRRFYFVMSRINELASLGRDDDGKSARASELLNSWATARQSVTPPKTKSARPKTPVGFDITAMLADQDWVRAFRAELMVIKRALAGYLSATRRCVEDLVNKRVQATGKLVDQAEGLRQLVATLNLDSKQLDALLKLPEDLRIERVGSIVTGGLDRVDAVVDFIAKRFESSTTPDIARPGDEALGTAAASARACIQFYYNHFFVYDMLAFPMQYETEAGETCEIEVYRISPEDAVLDSPQGGKKLAGTALMNFGAFLERAWRRNDMLWGRLDGAERLIQTILPGDTADIIAIRKALTLEAQEAILQEDLSADDAQALTRAFVTLLLQQMPNASSADAEQAARALADSPDMPCLSCAATAVIRASVTTEHLHDYIRSADYSHAPLNLQEATRNVTRATNIIGQMLVRLDNPYLTSHGRKLALFGRVAWWVVEAAAPQTLWGLFTRYWTGLVLICTLLLIGAGLAFHVEGAVDAGWRVLAVLVVLFIIFVALRDFFARRTGLRQFSLALLALILFALSVPLAVGIHEIWLRFNPPPHAEHAHKHHEKK